MPGRFAAALWIGRIPAPAWLPVPRLCGAGDMSQCALDNVGAGSQASSKRLAGSGALYR